MLLIDLSGPVTGQGVSEWFRLADPVLGRALNGLYQPAGIGGTTQQIGGFLQGLIVVEDIMATARSFFFVMMTGSWSSQTVSMVRARFQAFSQGLAIPSRRNPSTRTAQNLNSGIFPKMMAWPIACR